MAFCEVNQQYFSRWLFVRWLALANGPGWAFPFLKLKTWHAAQILGELYRSSRTAGSSISPIAHFKSPTSRTIEIDIGTVYWASLIWNLAGLTEQRHDIHDHRDMRSPGTYTRLHLSHQKQPWDSLWCTWGIQFCLNAGGKPNFNSHCRVPGPWRREDTEWNHIPVLENLPNKPGVRVMPIGLWRKYLCFQRRWCMSHSSSHVRQAIGIPRRIQKAAGELHQRCVLKGTPHMQNDRPHFTDPFDKYVIPPWRDISAHLIHIHCRKLQFNINNYSRQGWYTRPATQCTTP